VTPDWITITPVLQCLFMITTFTETWIDYYIVTRHLVLLNSCILESLIKRETPDTILLLIPVIGSPRIEDYYKYPVDIITGQSVIIEQLTTGWGN